MSDVPQDLIDQLVAQYLAEQGAPMTGEEATYAGAMPQYNLEGDPYTLTSQLNQMQDVNQLVADPVFQGMNGPGGFATDAFAPTVRMEAVESPEYVRWQNYLASPTSFEGMVAAELEGGGTPYSAIRKIRAKALEQPDGELAQELQALFPVMDDAGPVPGEINWQEISGAATSIDELRAEIPQLGNAGFTMEDGTVVAGGGEIMEVIGPDGRPQLVRRIEEPSPLAEKYRELGIPTPDEQYSPESFLGPDWTAQAENVEAQRGIYPEMEQAMWDAYNEWQDFEPYPEDEPQQYTPRPEGGTTSPTPPGGAVVEAPGPSTRQTTIDQLLPHDQTMWPDWMRQVYPTLTPNVQDEVDARLNELGQGEFIPAEQPSVLGGAQQVTAPDVLPDDQGAWDQWLSTVYPTLPEQDQRAVSDYLATIPNAPTPTAEPGVLPVTSSDLAVTGGNFYPGAPSAQGFMGALGPLGEPLPGSDDYSYTAPRGFDPASVEGRAFWPTNQPMEDSIGEWLSSNLLGNDTPPPPYAAPDAQSARQPGGIGHRLELAQPPAVTIDGEANPEYQQYLDRYMANRPAPPGPPQTGLPQSEQPGRGTQVADLPRELIGDWLVNNLLGGGGGVPMRTGEEDEERYDPLSSAGTGERVRRTPQSDARRPGDASHRTEVEGGARRQRFGNAVRSANAERVRFGQERQNVYGAAWGQALRAVYNAQQSGATPMQQVYAQRMQNVQNAGIPLASAPRVVSY